VSANVAAAAAAPSSESGESDDGSRSAANNSGSPYLVDLQALASAERSIEDQQARGLPPPYDAALTKKIVETAMLAAVAGLAYTLATLLKLEAYLSYALPLPVVLAALRGGPNAAVKCLTVAFLLLFSKLQCIRLRKSCSYEEENRAATSP